jgi:hypothetical protein
MVKETVAGSVVSARLPADSCQRWMADLRSKQARLAMGSVTCAPTERLAARFFQCSASP